MESYGAPDVKDSAQVDLRASVRAKGYELQLSVGTNVAPRTRGVTAQAAIRIPL